MKPTCKTGLDLLGRAARIRENRTDRARKSLLHKSTAAAVFNLSAMAVSSLSKCDDKHSCEIRVAKPWEQVLDGLGHSVGLPSHFAVVCKCGIEKQNRVPGWRRVEHDNAVTPFRHSGCECSKYGDLFSAWRPQVFFQHCPTFSVQVFSGRGQNHGSKRGNTGFTCGPQTPVEQHMGLSNTSTIFNAVFLSRSKLVVNDWELVACTRTLAAKTVLPRSIRNQS